jgi:hypothetical protein
MRYLLEYVTEQTALLRHPNMADTIRRFFADAGSNSVRAFYDDAKGFGGYVFHIMNRGDSSGEDDSGHYYKLVTTCDITLSFQEGSDDAPGLIRPDPIDRERLRRQFSNGEWFTGPFRGRLDRVAAVNIEDTHGESAS